MFPCWLSKFPDEYFVLPIVEKKNCVIFNINNRYLHINTNTKTYSFFNESDLRPYNQSDCPKNAVWYFHSGFLQQNMRAYDRDNNICYYKNLEVQLYSAVSFLETDSGFYLFDDGFVESGKIIWIKKLDLEITTLQTSNYEEIRLFSGKPVVDGNHCLYIGAYFNKYGQWGLARLCLNTLAWSLAFMGPDYYYVRAMFKIGDSIYFRKTMETFQSYNLSTNEFSGIFPFKGRNGHCIPIGCRRFAFPLARKSEKPHHLNLSFNILCLNMTLKDLAMEAVIKHELDISVLPKSIQQEMKPLKHYFEFNLEIAYK